MNSYESGFASKKSYLEKIALNFEKKNKGLYILISQLTEEEFIIRKEKELPDIICFSGNMGKSVRKYLCELEDNLSVKDCLLDSAKINGVELMAYPYSVGGYVLFSTASKLKNAGIELDSSNNLFSKVFSLGYQKKLKNKVQNVYSVAFGTKNKNKPLQVIKNEANIKGINCVSNELSYSQNHQKWTGYNAYESFIVGDSVMLLGTQRDLARIQTRVSSGKETDVIIEYLSYWTDLVDYVGVFKGKDSLKVEMSKKFAKFLLTTESQEKLKDVGLFSVICLNEPLYNDENFAKMEISLSYLSNVDNIFNL